MALTSEDLLAISQLMDVKLESVLESKLESKLQPIRDDIRFLKLQNENEILPRLQNIEECYLSTYERYKNGIMQLDAMQADIDIMKNVLMKHSEQLQKLV